MARAMDSFALTNAVVAILGFATPRVAAAESAALSWDACGAEVLAKKFACDTNDGTARLVVSAFRDSVGFVTSAFTCSLDVVVAQHQASTWWQAALGQCRSGSITSSIVPASQDNSCTDSWGGVLAMGMDLTYLPGQSTLSLSIVGADLTGTVRMQPLLETFVVSIDVDFGRSVGTSACEGCSSGACVVLRRVTFHDEGGSVVVPMPLRQGQSMLVWQTTLSACQTTPIRNRTWGAIKALYR